MQTKAEVANMPKQELQRVIPLFWSGSKSVVSAFFQHDFIAFLDVRFCTKQHKNKIQEILIFMDIPYHLQKRSVLVVYASGVILETCRQVVFQENILLPFGKEEGCFQYAFTPSSFKDAWQSTDEEVAGRTAQDHFTVVPKYKGHCRWNTATACFGELKSLRVSRCVEGADEILLRVNGKADRRGRSAAHSKIGLVLFALFWLALVGLFDLVRWVGWGRVGWGGFGFGWFGLVWYGIV